MALMLGVAALFLLPLLPIEHNLEMRIVESGSMEPSIMTGSLVVIVPASSYGLGDVVTFRSSSAEIPTTHRIIDTYEAEGRSWFITKGDANEEADTEAVAPSDVMGKIAVSIPYAGFILDFARQPIGFALLVVLPAIMIILGEIEKIWLEVRRRRYTEPEVVAEEDEVFGPPSVGVRAAEGAMRMMDIRTPVRYRELPPSLRVEPLKLMDVRPRAVRPSRKTEWATAAMVVFASSVFASVSFLPTTVSYFNDSESSVDNAMSGVSLDFTATPDDTIFSFDDGELVDDADGLVTTITLEPESVDGRFSVHAVRTGGSEQFCNFINASVSMPYLYTGALTALTATDVTFDAPYTMELTLPDASGLVEGDVCLIDIVYTAWHYDEDADQGYFDEERNSLTFMLVATGEVLIESFAAPLLLETVDVPTEPEGTEPPVPIQEPAPEPEGEEIPAEETEPTEPAEPPIEPEEETEPEEASEQDVEPESEEIE